jgi:hypothetical protein
MTIATQSSFVMGKRLPSASQRGLLVGEHPQFIAACFGLLAAPI